MSYPAASTFLEHTFFRGRVAMAAMLRALGVGRGHSVAIQAFTCLAVPEGVIATGAKPVYVDVERNGLTLDPDALEVALAGGARAVVIQHSYGLPADMERTAAVAAKYGVPIIEDCAHALGSAWAGRPVGEWGVGSFYSFEASKPIFAGMGGCAIPIDPQLAKTMTEQRSAYHEPPMFDQAQILAMYLGYRVLYRPFTYWTLRRTFRALVKAGVLRGNYNEFGFDAKPAEDFSRTLGRLQLDTLRRELKGLDKRIAHRKRVATRMMEQQTGPGLRRITIPAKADPVFTRVPFFAEDKPRTLARAAAERVELADFYNTVIHPVSTSRLNEVGYTPGSCPNAEWASAHVVSLPTNEQMSGSALDRALAFLGAGD